MVYLILDFLPFRETTVTLPYLLASNLLVVRLALQNISIVYQNQISEE